MQQEKFLYRVADHLLKRFGSELHQVAIVFNNKRPQLFLKKYLSEISGKPIWSPRFFTIQQFFAASTTQTTASQLKQFFTLFTQYNKLLQTEGKEALSADVFYPLAEVIVSDFSQIDYYLADPAKVFSLIGGIAELQHQFPNFEEEQLQFMESFWSSFSPERNSKVQEKFIEMWHRMPVLYKNFHQALAAEKLVTSAGMYRNLAEGRAGRPDFINQFEHVVFVGFNALSKAEELLFRRWQDEGRCSFYFDADGHYFTDPQQEAGHFIRRNIQTVGLVNQFDNEQQRINNPAKIFNVVQALGNVAQGKLLPKLLSAHGQEQSDTRAIILADESLLLPVLQTVSDDQLNITMGYPFEQSAVYGFCDLWLNIQEEIASLNRGDIDYQNVLTFTMNPLANVGQADRDKILSEIIDGKKTRFAIGELKSMDKISSLTFSDYVNPANTIRNFGSALLLIAERLQELRKLEILLIAEAVKTLNVLSDSFQDLAKDPAGLEIEPKFVFRTIRRALAGLSVPFDGEPLSGLQIMGLLESRCLDFDEIVVLGMNEDILPKKSITPSFIPDNVRRAFGLPVLENQNSIFAYFFYRLLHCAKKITLVYNGITDDKSSGEESRFIKQLQFETRCTFNELVQQHQPVQNEGYQKIVVEKTGLVRQSLEKYFRRNADPKFDKKIFASAFTDYVSCPLKFFYSKVAGLKEPGDLPDQIGANLIGSMVHSVMENYYRSSVGSEVTVEFIELQEKKLPAMCLEAFTATVNKSPLPSSSPGALQQIVLKVLEQYALKIIRHDKSIAPFSIVELENRDSYALLVDVRSDDKNEQVRLGGIIDRVDRHRGMLRIVDYKTGGDKLKYKDIDGLFSDEKKHQNKALIQILFYTYVYEKSRSVAQVEPHLYTVRDFRSGTLFSQKGTNGLVLNDTNLATFKEEFEAQLSIKLNELFDMDTPFVQTEELATCTYCPYKEICQR